MYEMNFLSTPFKVVKDREVTCTYEGLDFWERVVESMAEAAENVYEECFIVCALNTDGYPLCFYLVRGGVHNVRIPDLFRTAVLYGVSNVLVAHKYPTKTAIPTADLRFFMDIAEDSPLIGIKVIDYILIGGQEVIFSVQQSPDILDHWDDPEEFVQF